MTKIILNTTEFEIDSYGRNTYFNGETISSNANCSILNSDATELNELLGVAITTIQIYHDNNLIYDLQDINARIESINEYLSGNRIGTSINLVFDNTQNL